MIKVLGSFTGIRIGISTIKAFADVYMTIPVIGISSLQALAYNIKNGKIICSLIDAGHDNVYLGVYESVNLNGKSYCKELVAPFSDNIYNVIGFLKTKDFKFITFVGSGLIRYNSILSENFDCKFSDENDLNSVQVGIAGLNEFLLGNYGNSESLLPLYVKKSSAEQNSNN